MKVGVINPDGMPGWNIVNPPVNPEIWVWLDEKRVRECVAADDAAGKVWVHARLPNGVFVMTEEGDKIALEVKTGKVEIRFLNS